MPYLRSLKACRRARRRCCWAPHLDTVHAPNYDGMLGVLAAIGVVNVTIGGAAQRGNRDRRLWR
ncbi:hypothetical protein MJ575_15215 [Klebsiella pneumoniae]|nr:hypothetical protein MJ575_15215 [Klebsiella pneumoniae]